MIDTPVTVAGELTIDCKDLPEGALDVLKARVAFPNEEKETAAREMVHNWWSLPDLVELARVESRRDGRRVLLLPRGFAAQLAPTLAEFDARPVFDDRRVALAAEDGYFHPFVLRDYQADAVADLIKSEQGFLQMPGGGGKTNVMLGLAAHLGLRTLVIMDKADIVDQWRERATQFLGIEDAGKIGMDVWDEQDLTIALRQTLWSRIDELDATNWWANWGLWICDEAHHIQSSTMAEVSRRCVSRYMFGCSATPARSPVRGQIVEALVGPVIHRTERSVLREQGILVKPEVRRVDTGFEAEFWETHKSAPDGKCQVEGCPKAKNGKQHQHRNNYQSCLKKVKEDKARNEMIAKTVASERGHIHLVPSRHLNHLDILKKVIEGAGWDGPIFYLRGEENLRKESRDIVAQIMESHEAVILSTVADEALDVPPIDRLHLVFPMRQSALVEQIIGRCERSYNGKQDAVVYDYVDSGCDAFLNQAIERFATYKRLGLVA